MTSLTRQDPAYQAAMAFLYERLNYERTLDRPYNEQYYRLNRMRQLLQLLGDPHLAAPVVHVAGTKGKGSVSWLLAETMRHAGFRTGLYSSPHLVDLEERWQVDGTPVTPRDVVEMVELLRPAVEGLSSSEHGPPTFFELTTALAWLLFRHFETAVNIIEVGLGGRLDSTNVCTPTLTIITSISLDHQQQLGSTIGRIAGEKAGIIKSGIPVISGAIVPEANAVIEHVAWQQNAAMFTLGRDFFVQAEGMTHANDSTARKCNAFSFHWNGIDQGPRREHWPIKMLGAHQAHNAALVCAAIDQLTKLGWDIAEDALYRSLANTQVTGRMEVRGESPTLLLDTAHNIASVQALIETIETSIPSRRRILIFSASRDKDYDEMIRLLSQRFDSMVLTQFQTNPRAVPLETLESLVHSILNEQTASRPTIYCAKTPVEAMECAKKLAQPDDLICVTGSFFLAAELLAAGAI